MRLTPADVHNVAFKKPSIGKRGYDEDEVDAFLDLVEDELSRLIEENNDLTRRNGELGERLGAFESGETPPALSAVPVAQKPLLTASAASSDDQLATENLHKGRDKAPEQQEAVAPAQEQAPEPAPALAPQQIAAPAAEQPGPADHHVHAARLLGLAEETASRLTSEAQAHADTTKNSAQAESDRLVTEARTQSEKALTDAQNRAEKIVGDATSKAEAATRDSQLKAEALDRESQRKYTETMNELNSQKTTLEKKIDDLRAYEREYRTRLKGWITEQLAQLDESGGATAAAPAK